jgi:hypothetical protein
MFLLVQFPVADLRSLAENGFGRLTTPDWKAVDHADAFIRGFGKVASRVASGYGLYGERAFADFKNAALFRERLGYEQDGWSRPLNVHPWFRRFYFDGYQTGRFEFGFFIFSDQEGAVFYHPDATPLHPGTLASALSQISMDIRSIDGSRQRVTLGSCAQALGCAYLAATTKQDQIDKFPPAETYGKYFAIGRPIFHIRVTPDVRVVEGRDRRIITNNEYNKLYITSSPPSHSGNVIVQVSSKYNTNEPADERAIRVIFSHLNALIFSHSHVLSLDLAEDTHIKKRLLKENVAQMLKRFYEFQSAAPSDKDDEAFLKAMKAFASGYTGRVEELAEKLEGLAAEINAPTVLQKVGAAAKNIFELILTTSIKAGVESATKLT